jgi:hypothetical protein
MIDVHLHGYSLVSRVAINLMVILAIANVQMPAPALGQRTFIAIPAMTKGEDLLQTIVVRSSHPNHLILRFQRVMVQAIV